MTAPGDDATGREAGGAERETIRQRMWILAHRWGAWLARTLPEPAGRRAFRWAALLAHRFVAGARAIVEANQAQVLGLPIDHPLVRSAGREAFLLYARYWLDTFRGPWIGEDELHRRFDGDDSLIREALDAGRGCITVLPHMGNWDIAGRWVSTRLGRIVVVAEELKPQRLSDLYLSHREALGMEVVPLTVDGHVGQQLARHLASNRIVALVADRDLTGRGIEVEMFGRPRRVPAGPALLSIKSGAPLLVCPVTTTDDGWSLSIRAIEFDRSGNLKADVAELTSRMAREFERAIAANPTDWHMFQPAWDA